MQTLTQRKKGWWKIWAVIIALIVIVAILAVASMLTDAEGNPYFDAAPYADGYLSVFMWASAGITNAVILTVLMVGGGVFLAYLFYNYLRGQQTKQTAQTPGYNPPPTTPTQTGQSGTETVIS